MNENKIFYISYANLLAGLFFVICFIVGAILLKNALARGEIFEQKANLRTEKLRFEREKEAFRHEQELVFELGRKIKDGQISGTNSKKNQPNSSLNDKKNQPNLLANKEQISGADAEILALLSRLDDKERRFKRLNDDFEALKAEFKELGFVKGNFVFEIQAKFDANISTNELGAIILPSEDFFERGSHFIKNESKVKLRGILSEFFNAVLRNKDFLSGLELINIQIFVGSEGVPNLQKNALAFRRADELMSFIEGFYKDKRIFNYLLISPAYHAAHAKAQPSTISTTLIMSNDYLLAKMQDLLNKN